MFSFRLVQRRGGRKVANAMEIPTAAGRIESVATTTGSQSESVSHSNSESEETVEEQEVAPDDGNEEV